MQPKIGAALAASFCLHALLVFSPLSPLRVLQSRPANPQVLQVRLLAPAERAENVARPEAQRTALGEPAAAGGKPRAAWVPDMHYYSPEELSSKPELIYNTAVAMPFPDEPLSDQHVVAELFINEYGGVDRVEIVESSLHATSNERLQEAFREARFRPGGIEGFSVKNRMRIEIRIGAMP